MNDMKTMNIKSTDYRVQITESGSVPGSVLAAIRKASVLCTLCSVLLISSCTHDEIIPPTPLAPQGTKTVTVDFQLPEGKPGFEVQSTDNRVQSTDNRGQSTDSRGQIAETSAATDGLCTLYSELCTLNATRSTASWAEWAEGDELLMRLEVSNINEEISGGTADFRSACLYLTLVHDGKAWDVNEAKSYSVTAMGVAITAKPYAQLPLLAASQDLALTSLTLMLDENFGEVGECFVQVLYAPDVERVAGADGKLLLQLKATATTTAPEMWQAAAASGTGSLALKWMDNGQARLRVHTGVAGDVVTLTSEKFYSNSIGKSADGIYTATTQTDGYAYFYGKAGTIDESDNPIALTSGFNLSLTTVTVRDGDAAFTCPIPPVTLLEASTLVPVQLVEGNSYRLDATEKRTAVTNTITVIDGTLQTDALQTAIIDAIVDGKTTLYVTGEQVGDIGSAISYSGAEDGTIDLILADATAIGESAFHGCNALASVSAPKATAIGESAFHGCSALASVSLPDVTEIGKFAFVGCTSLTSVSLPEAETIGEGALSSTSLTSVSLPDVTEIGIYAFSGCNALASVSLPAARSIGDQAFFQCEDLASVSLPAATSIGDGAFAFCTALASVSLPAATTIGDQAFNGCYALTSVTFGSVIKSVGNYSFQNLHETCTLTLNSGQLSSTDENLKPSGNTWAGETWASIRYVDDEGNAVTVIDGAATDAVTAQISAALAAGQSTIYVTGTTLGTAVKSAIKAQADGSIDLVLPAATSIGNTAFQNCTALKSVSAPKATTIETNAFENCTALTSVSLPAATSIGINAFYACTALTSVSLPAATTIETYAFSGCTALTSLTFGEVITSVGTYPFNKVPTENCALTLNSGQLSSTGDLKPNGNIWAEKTWKSITLVDSN